MDNANFFVVQHRRPRQIAKTKWKHIHRAHVISPHGADLFTHPEEKGIRFYKWMFEMDPGQRHVRKRFRRGARTAMRLKWKHPRPSGKPYAERSGGGHHDGDAQAVDRRHENQSNEEKLLGHTSPPTTVAGADPEAQNHETTPIESSIDHMLPNLPRVRHCGNRP